MLGSYYLGYVYLGKSGTNISTDFYIDDSYVASVSDNSDINVLISLLINSARILSTSDILDLICLIDIVINDSAIDTVARSILRIIDWTSLGVEYGGYLKEFSENGSISAVELDETGLYEKKYDNRGIF